MFSTNLNSQPVYSRLYGYIAVLLIPVTICFFVFGKYDEMWLLLTTAGVCFISSTFFILNRQRSLNPLIHLFTMASIAILMLYYLGISGTTSYYWILTFPLFSFFVLRLTWGIYINFAFYLGLLDLASSNPSSAHETEYLAMYGLMSLSAFSYAYLNYLKRTSLITLAVTDQLSGAFNERHLSKVLEQEVARSKVTNRTLSLLAITIDDYQQIMDIHGPRISEDLLRAFASENQTLLRAGDELFHDGRGTFYILLPNCPMEGASVLRLRLLKHLEHYDWDPVGDLQLNTGYATLNPHESASSFLKRAANHVEKQQKTALRLLAFDQ